VNQCFIICLSRFIKTRWLIRNLVYVLNNKLFLFQYFRKGQILFRNHRSSLHWLAALKCIPTHAFIINFVSNIQSVYINVVTTLIPPRTFVAGGTIITVVRIIVSVFSTEGFPINWYHQYAWVFDWQHAMFDRRVFQQTVGIPMDTNCASLLADFFPYSYEADFIQWSLM
jgi:hypothetical protein